jgi:hypothetical protein
MTILFHVNLRTFLRHFESVVLELAARGHTMRIASAAGRTDVPPPASLLGHERISFVEVPDQRSDAWAGRIVELRMWRDYLRYLDKRFEGAQKLRARTVRKFAATVTHDERTHLVGFCPHCSGRLVDNQVGVILRTGLSKKGFKNLRSLLALMEDTIPSDPAIDALLHQEKPDVLVITPLIKLASPQPEFVKSARHLGIPVVYPVFSWDNLSTKGLVHVQPDVVLVWNERQRVEAVEMHQVPDERIVVTGAARFDEFFAMRPQTTREAFHAAHGLDPRQRTISYLCSSEFVAGHEFEFVQRWIEEIRREPALRSCNVLIRPHPRRTKAWKTFEPVQPGIAVSMPQGMNGDQTLFDTVYHSGAVVGLNTSAELEAGIVGRPVLTVLAPESSGGQRGTLHFDYLLKEHGGFVELASDMDTHRRQLAAAIAGNYDADAIRGFMRNFLRPQGLDRPVTPIVADAIVAAARPAPPAGVPVLPACRET